MTSEIYRNKEAIVQILSYVQMNVRVFTFFPSCTEEPIFEDASFFKLGRSCLPTIESQ